MAFTHDELTRLASAPTSAKAEAAYDQIKRALENSSRLKFKDFDIYLQGSYSNKTNVKDDSDIDVVVQLNTTWKPDLSKLSALEQAIYHTTFPTAQYTWSNFRDDVYHALVDTFGQNNVEDGKKCIKIKGNSTRLNADVIPAITFRKYNRFSTVNRSDFIEGITFWTTDTVEQITNFPKIHKENGSDKNSQQRTNGIFKDFVRIYKNIRGEFVDHNLMDLKDVQSYFVECLMYNIPDIYFVPDYTKTFDYVNLFVLQHQNLHSFKTVSHQHDLFGIESYHWKPEKAKEFIGLVQAWDKLHNGN